MIAVHPAARSSLCTSHFRANFSVGTPLARLSASSFRLDASDSLMWSINLSRAIAFEGLGILARFEDTRFASFELFECGIALHVGHICGFSLCHSWRFMLFHLPLQRRKRLSSECFILLR